MAICKNEWASLFAISVVNYFRRHFGTGWIFLVKMGEFTHAQSDVYKQTNSATMEAAATNKTARAPNFTEQDNILLSEIMGEKSDRFSLLTNHQLDKARFGNGMIMLLILFM